MIDTDLPVITSNYRILLHDDGLPILFTGANRLGVPVIGSSVDENYRQGVERYFHILVAEKDYLAFLGRDVSYRQLLERSKPIFVVDKNVSDESYSVSQITFDDIPQEYRPSEDAYCPVYPYEPSYTYSSSLIGGLADRHHAFPEDVSNTQNTVAKLLNRALETMRERLGIESRVLLQPATESSFAINYEVQLANVPSLFVSETDLLSYLNDFLSYCLKYLPADSKELAKLNFNDLPAFNRLIQVMTDLLGATNPAGVDRTEVAESLVKNLSETSALLEGLTKNIGNNYESIAITNVTRTSEQPLGLIDKSYKEQLKEAAPFIQQLSFSMLKAVEAADEQELYSIHVYDFNKQTGKGFAYVRDPQDESKVIQAAIEIEDYEPVSPSKFTHSLDQGIYIQVRANKIKYGNRVRLVVKEKEEEQPPLE